ncbi:type II toxin-antitoxin system ParD family antitoxin [Sphingobium cloacae]|uniref:type II toxin-antitoxin system ParD family antitoxin n=1 Tax=Sphingobium cloacae TaxID=120107 RepID=UPI00082C965F|nr:type II toxin-antitoxin system ParD family antitoxin [Sphingobium cloacae]
MATMNVSLPDAMKQWVEGQAATGRYNNAKDYVRDLIRRDQERREKIVTMQNMVDKALASGVSSRSMDDVIKEARCRADTDHGL